MRYLPMHPLSAVTAFVRAKTSCSMLRLIPGYAAMVGAG